MRCDAEETASKARARRSDYRPSDQSGGLISTSESCGALSVPQDVFFFPRAGRSNSYSISGALQ
jgi:hypothetical protein